MKKILESVGEIRLDVGEHRICLEDVLCFLTGRDVYDHVAQRFKTLASTHGLKALGNALARTPGHMFRGVGGSRSKSMTYINKPSEFTKIVVELVRHYYSTRLNKGRKQGQVATLWPKVVDFHLNLGRTWPELWDAAHCGACGEAPLLADAGLQYPELAPLLAALLVSSSKVRRSGLTLQLPQAHATLPRNDLST